MVTADVLAVVFSLLAIFLAVPAFQLVVRAMWPRLEEQSRRRFAMTPIRTVIFGALLGIPLVLPALGLMAVENGAVKLIGVWWFGGAMAISLVGLSGLASQIGATIPGPTDSLRPWFPMVKGSVALELACLIPVFGWFLLFPVLLAAGAGAAGLALVKPLRPPPTADAESNLWPLRQHA